MDKSERYAKLKSFLEQVAADKEVTRLKIDTGGLESMNPDIESANAGLEAIETGNLPTEDQMHGLEAIVLPKERPVVNIVGDSFAAPPSPWQHLATGPAKQHIESVIPSIGRIEVPFHPSVPYGGTGFVVGDNIIMTNRHVAALFASGVGEQQLAFLPGQTSAVDFKREIQPSDPVLVSVTKILTNPVKVPR